MEVKLTIVGIRNYLPNGEDDYDKLFQRLPIGTSVYLRKEPTGTKYPGSVTVLDDEGNKIGSVSKTERRCIELDIPQNRMLQVKISGHSKKHNCMYFTADNKNGFKEPYIREVPLEEGETSTELCIEDNELQKFTSLLKTKIEMFQEGQTEILQSLIKNAQKYAKLCCISLDGETSFSRTDILVGLRTLNVENPELTEVYSEIFEAHKDIGRSYNDVKTNVYREQYNRIFKSITEKRKNGKSQLDDYIENLKFLNNGTISIEILDQKIKHLEELLSKELMNSYVKNVNSDTDFADALYSLNYSMQGIYRMLTRKIRLDHLRAIRKKMTGETCETTQEQLDTPEAQIVLQKAVKAGWLDAKLQPTRKLSTKVSKAIFANVLANKLNIPSPMYEPFEKLWNEKNLDRSYSSGNQANINQNLITEIKESLK